MKFIVALSAALVLLGGFSLVGSALAPNTLSPNSGWSSTQSAELARLDTEILKRRIEFFAILRRQELPHDTPEPVAIRLLDDRIRQLRQLRQASWDRPKRVSETLRTIGIVALSAGVVVYGLGRWFLMNDDAATGTQGHPLP